MRQIVLNRLKSAIGSADCVFVRRSLMALIAALVVATVVLPLGVSWTSPAGAATAVGVAPARPTGAWAVDRNGRVTPRGGAPALGSLPRRANRRVVGITSTPSGRGYWLVTATGGVFTFGDAGFHGSLATHRLARPVTRLTRTTSGRGYWLVASTGKKFAFGDAARRPTTTSATPAVPAAASGRQAWLWPFASTSPWNMPIGSGAQYASAADPKVRAITDPSHVPWVNAGQYSHPLVTASSSDPLVTLQRRGQSPVSLRIPAGAVPAGGSDGHLHVVDPSRRWVDETWATSRAGAQFSTASHVHTDLTGPGVGQGGVRAYGGSAIGGLIRSWELEAGAIRHALAIALANDQLRRGWVWPATAEDGDAAGAYRGPVPMGSLLAIPPSVDLARLGLTSDGLMVARALRDYGAYVVDRASGPILYAEPSLEQSRSVANLRTDMRVLRSLLRVVTNNTATSVGGGGTPRAPLAPSL